MGINSGALELLTDELLDMGALELLKLEERLLEICEVTLLDCEEMLLESGEDVLLEMDELEDSEPPPFTETPLSVGR